MRVFTTVLLAFTLGAFTQTVWSQKPSSARQTAAAPSTPPSVQTGGQSKIDPAKEADIRRLLELVGTKTVAMRTIEEMTTTVRPVLANSLPPGEYRDKLIDLFFAKFKAKADAQRIVDLAVPVYDKHFSREEIKGLIQFYQTPLGHKTTTELPAIMGELRAAGEEWGKVLGRDSMQQVLAEHPELQEALNKAAQANKR
jgi:hypothetical protein